MGCQERPLFDLFDTNVIVSGILFPDSILGKVVNAILEGHCRPILSDAILAEYDDVLVTGNKRHFPARWMQGIHVCPLRVFWRLARDGSSLVTFLNTRLCIENHHPIRWTPLTASKCSSRLTIGSRCWRHSAAIQMSFSGIGWPASFSSLRMSA